MHAGVDGLLRGKTRRVAHPAAGAGSHSIGLLRRAHGCSRAAKSA
jgi:hypothetical protein